MSTQSVPLHYNLESTKEGIEFTITYDQRLLIQKNSKFCGVRKIVLGDLNKPS